jgi:hypothetical protein
VPGTTATLDRLELRIGRLGLVFRFTYAFHAREVRFECDRGDGFERIFPETFSFHPDRHDPAEIFLQLQDLASKPRLLAPAARRRDAEVLISRFLLAVPRYLEKLLHRLEGDARLDAPRLDRVYTDVALLAQIVTRFGAGRVGEEQQGIRMAVLHLRKLAYRTLFRLVERRVDPDYLAGYVAGTADLIDPGDDLSESGFFHTLENGEPDAVNRTLLRLGERAFYRWLEDVCLDEQNGAFEVEDSPFESREIEVRRAISTDGRLLVERGRELIPFLRRPGNRDCLRLLEKLEAWFLRQYDIHHAAVMIQHADNVANQIDDADRILSRHRTRNYVMALAAMAIPFVGAAIAYDRAPRLFDALCSLELVLANLAVLWFLFYRFLWRRNRPPHHRRDHRGLSAHLLHRRGVGAGEPPLADSFEHRRAARIGDAAVPLRGGAAQARRHHDCVRPGATDIPAGAAPGRRYRPDLHGAGGSLHGAPELVAGSGHRYGPVDAAGPAPLRRAAAQDRGCGALLHLPRRRLHDGIHGLLHRYLPPDHVGGSAHYRAAVVGDVVGDVG